jgi:hypothetical protein
LKPLLVASSSVPESQPFYISELLTVVQGHQGQQAQTLALMRNSISPDAAKILFDGDALALNTLEAINHLRGRTVYSLGVVSAAYFYNPEGVPVRSLFYGFLFWINYGPKADVQKRKEIFCAFRGQFEAKLLKHKPEIINRISRRIGSGGEVTFQTARYFNGLLELVMEFKDELESAEFDQNHAKLLEELRKTSGKIKTNNNVSSAQDNSNVVASRVASSRQRSRIALEQELTAMPVCGICQGRLLIDDPLNDVQYDHVLRHSDGGATSDHNLRPTHAFCNHRRDSIEAQRAKISVLPAFIDSQGRDPHLQLTFSQLWNDPEEDALLTDEEVSAELDSPDEEVTVDEEIFFEDGDDNDK